MAKWSNWSGRVRCEPSALVAVSDEAEAVAVVQRARHEGRRLRVAGAGHSHAPLVPTEGIVVDSSGLTGVVAVDAEAGLARIRAGTRIADLGAPLRSAGVALLNQGDIDRQTIAGATATGTHGTGRTLQNLSAGVVGARLVRADGELVECDAASEPQLLEVLRLSLGAVGLVTELTLRVRGAYRLKERLWLEDLDAVLDRIEELTHATRHFEFFWMPSSRRAACKAIEETDEAPVHPLAEEGKRLSWSNEVLANDRPDKHTEMEYSLPAEQGVACLRALREMIHRDFPDLGWPLEYRTLAADEVWLSPAYRRETVTLSVHQGIDQEDGPLFRACEAIFRAHDGRPHWGKVHYRNPDELRAIHPRHADWWRVRDEVDPDGLFLNEACGGWLRT
jgi:FAD/FMN-containing dehydrogenase